jgi:hypothetical protein
MTNLEALPDELLDRIIDFLEKRDVTKVRLLNKRLSQISTAELFRIVTLCPQWQRGDDKDERHSVDSEQDEGWAWAGRDEPPQLEDIAWDDPDNEWFESVVPIAGVPGAEPEEALPPSEVMNPDQPEVEVVNSRNLDKDDEFKPASGQCIPIALSPRVRPISLPLSHYGGCVPRWAVDRLPGPPGHDAQSFESIMLHETLRNYVKEIEIYTCDPHCVRSLL